LLRAREETEKKAANSEMLLKVAVRILKTVHDAEGRKELLAEVCRSFLEDEDYCLVWIGAADQESGRLDPLAVDGSTTMTCDEYSDCLKTLCGLVEQGNGDNDLGHEALQSGKAVVGRDILHGVPQGPFKKTPFYQEKVSSLSLPMMSSGGSTGVVTLYTVQPNHFDDMEIAVLQALVNSVAFTLNCQERISGREEMFRASQFASIGELAADVAHEINNLSNGIINYAQILADEVDGLGSRLEHEQLLGKVIQEGERIAAISNRLLAYSEDPELEDQHFRIDQVIEEALEFISHRLRNDGVEVRKYLPEDTPDFIGNRQKILHLFLNILNNAWQALNKRFPGKDKNKLLEIRTELIRKGDRELIRSSITDRGIGISEDEILRVFDPDFTTRQHGAGSGLGLAISDEIVRTYGGEIRIDSEVDDHTMVVVDLPL
jgi:signal transduction histidine kinase